MAATAAAGMDQFGDNTTLMPFAAFQAEQVPAAIDVRLLHHVNHAIPTLDRAPAELEFFRLF